MDGDGEEVGGVVDPLAKVVFTDFARCGKMRFGNLVGAVDAIGADAGLLDAGEDGEGRTRTDAGDAEQFPAAGYFLADGTQ